MVKEKGSDYKVCKFVEGRYRVGTAPLLESVLQDPDLCLEVVELGEDLSRGHGLVLLGCVLLKLEGGGLASDSDAGLHEGLSLHDTLVSERSPVLPLDHQALVVGLRANVHLVKDPVRNGLHDVLKNEPSHAVGPDKSDPLPSQRLHLWQVKEVAPVVGKDSAPH